MNRRVLVESSLNDHIQFLENSGYDVIKVDGIENASNLQSFDYDAIVISSTNSMPMDTNSFRPGAPLVDARDKSPEEVFNILRSRY